MHLCVIGPRCVCGAHVGLLVRPGPDPVGGDDGAHHCVPHVRLVSTQTGQEWGQDKIRQQPRSDEK